MTVTRHKGTYIPKKKAKELQYHEIKSKRRK